MSSTSPREAQPREVLTPSELWRLSPTTIGTICGVVSAAAYAGASFCLRRVVLNCDPVWVACVRAVPVAVVSLTLVVLQTRQGRTGLPPRRLFGALLATAVFVQFGGNVSFQWAMGQIGLAMTTALTYSTLILGGALLGWIFLGEKLSLHATVGLAILLGAVGLLTLGAGDAAASMQRGEPESLTLLAWAVGAAGLPGIAYAVCNAVIRRMVTNYTSLSGTLVFFSVTGVVVLGFLSVAREGFDGFPETDSESLAYMIAAGLLNAVAFYGISKGLQLMPIARANALNASQLAMVALMGMVFFDEAASLGLIGGLALMIAGLFLLHRGGAKCSREARGQSPSQRAS